MEVGPSWGGQVVWFAVIALISYALPWVMLSEADLGLSQAVITLQEGFLGLLVVSAYLGITRAIMPPTKHTIDGWAVVGVGPRVLYYAAVGVLATLAHLDRLPDVLPAGIEEWLRVNVEAYAAMLLIPLYFDVIAVARTKSARLIWYSSLVLVPLAVHGGLLDGILPASLLDWIARATEAFIAAAVVSVYFKPLARPRTTRPPTGRGRPQPGRVTIVAPPWPRAGREPELHLHRVEAHEGSPLPAVDPEPLEIGLAAPSASVRVRTGSDRPDRRASWNR